MSGDNKLDVRRTLKAAKGCCILGEVGVGGEGGFPGYAAFIRTYGILPCLFVGS